MFNGFSPKTVDFLWGIRMNNDREWFTDHKTDYTTYLYEPMKELGKHLFTPFLDRPGNILKVSRIYRDARLHHPLPYKESLWICIRQDVDWWAENPCLFFEITPDGIAYGFIFYRPRPAVMEEIRRHIAARPDAFLKLIRETEEKTGIPVTARLYKKPKPTDDPALLPYFAWKDNISCVRKREFSPEVFGTALADEVTKLFEALIPLYEYFNQFCV